MKAIVGWLILLLAIPLQAERFHFVALGDTAYNLDKDLPVYERLIGAINESSPAFSIHVGDTWGALPCGEDNHLWVRSWFDKYTHPLIYTPGDNEWTDCRKPEVLEAYSRLVTGKASDADKALLAKSRSLDAAFAATGYTDTLQSLQTIRRTFFANAESMGAVKMPLVRQSDVSTFSETVENTRWQRSGVVFATVSVPGSQNGFVINDVRRASEAVHRNAANIDWIKSTFAHAEQENAKAVVIALHASIFLDGDGSPFSDRVLRGGMDGPYYWIALAIRELSEKFARPVLLVHGDFHEFVIDRPFAVSQGEAQPPKYANITRLQVFGAPDLRAVRVNVDTDTPWVFSYSPLYVD
jgi:hypothetical protein